MTLVPTGVRITNSTQYPSAEVRKIVRRALRDLDVKGVHVDVYHRRGNSDHTTGEYREHWYPREGEDRPVIKVGLPKFGISPGIYHPYERENSPPVFALADWREALVMITAHEAMHHRQAPRNNFRSHKRVRRDGAVRPGKRRFVEIECDWAAYRAWKRWREEGAYAAA